MANKMNLSRRFGLFFALTAVLALVSGMGNAYGQSSGVTLDMENVPMSEVMKAIESQTTYLFMNQDVDVSVRVTVKGEGISIGNALDQMVRGTGVNYSLTSGRNIILSNKVRRTAPNTLAGLVKDQTGEPVPGASVLLKNSKVGANADLDGAFSIELPKGFTSDVIEVSFLGYKTVSVPVTDKRYFDFVLVEDREVLEAGVVTALGIKRSEKALNYNVQQVSSEKITAIKDANLVNSLSGKVAGVNINASSSGVGGETKVVMRGTKGINSSSNALYVIDGIPMYTMGDNGETSYGSRGRSEGIADINAEDIESISVLTGAAAAALYGSNASNGAIIINTKKGQEGKLSLTVTSNTEMQNALVLPRFQNRYGNVEGEAMSWGSLLKDGEKMNYNPGQDFLRTGFVGTETVSFSTGNQRNQVYASLGAVDSKGIIPNNGYHRYNASIRSTSSFLEDKLHLDVSAQYVKQRDLNMVNQGIYGNPLVAAYLYPRGEDWEWAKMFEQYDDTRKIYVQNWDLMGKGGLEWDNPYWTQYRRIRKNNKDRYMISGGLTWDILDWMKLSGRVKLDNTDNTYTDKTNASTNTTITEGSSNGYYFDEESAQRQIYADVLLSINKSWGGGMVFRSQSQRLGFGHEIQAAESPRRYPRRRPA